MSPVGQSDIPRGSTVQFACTHSHVLTQGQLTLACDDDGKLIGQLPVCLGEAFTPFSAREGKSVCACLCVALTPSVPGRGS